MDAARMITGLTRKTSLAVVLAEAELEKFVDILTADSLLLFEACRRKEGTLGYGVAEKGSIAPGTEQRRSTWRRQMVDAAREHKLLIEVEKTPIGPCEVFVELRVPPWDEFKIAIRPDLVTKVEKDDQAGKLKAAKEAIAALPKVNSELYTDGSADGNEKGGAGVFLTHKGRQLDVRTGCSAGRVCTSFQAALVALRLGLQCVYDDIAEEGPDDGLNVYTDSQSLLRWLQRGPGAAVHKDDLLVWNLL
eukprot:TRINITY_DN423_c2_g1_i6.p1 TRINITY_DN423_c2_g1~~TRINITY_DN423_c2_g1_i6.p1  ORF type:complete len:248 (-),score=75.18 TRINITY_DN423_c2_g1_i6:632-1375(-)